MELNSLSVFTTRGSYNLKKKVCIGSADFRSNTSFALVI